VKGLVNSIIFGLGAAVLLSAAPAWTADIKIAVVDYGKLMEESPQAKAVSDALRNEFTPRQRDLAAQQAAVKSKAPIRNCVTALATLRASRANCRMTSTPARTRRCRACNAR
jgi:hypothetical protein